MCVCLVTQSCPTLCNPMDNSPRGFSVHGNPQARILEWIAMPSSRTFPNSGIKPRSPELQAYSLPSKPPGKPKKNGMGSLSLLQGIFPTQGSNPGLPNCRQILYQLSYQGSPRVLESVAYPFSSGSSQPRSRTGVACFAGGFFTS